jgi:hypothetical protein
LYAKLIENKIVIFDSYAFKRTIKEIPGSIWDAENRVWIVELNNDNLTILRIIDCKFDEELLKKSKEFSSNETKNKSVTSMEPMPINATPYSHQVEAYNRACSRMGIFKGGDENIKRRS